MKKLACVLALTSAFVSMDALAWGNDGHRAVGAIADKLLKGSNAEKQIAALLLPGESLESIANWADCVKGTYCGPQTPEMVNYTAGNPKHSEYHYTDVPFQLPHYHDGGVGTSEVDIVQTLKQAIAVLQGKTDPALNPHNFTNSYWDSTTVDYAFRRIQTRTPGQFADAAIAGKPAIKANSGDLVTWPYQWADDALVVSKEAYKDVVPGKLVPQVSKKGETYYTFTLEVPANYPVPSSQIAKEQLIKGGYKLAEVLKAIYG
jgi:hypothetical protein